LIGVSILIAQNRPDEAGAAAREALDSTRDLGSALVHRQLVDVGRRLAPYRSNPTVAEFLHCPRHELDTRRWLTAGLPAGVRPTDTERS
jgi:hypothetical protein